MAVFHATGMGGRAFESLAAQGAFACVFDFCTQELGNHIHGSNLSAGPERLTSAGLNGTPQLVAPGCGDLVDIVGWQTHDVRWKDHPKHAHNRLLSSIVLDQDGRRAVVRAHATQLAQAKGPVTLLLPRLGLVEWDREGFDLHDPARPDAFQQQLLQAVPDNVDLRQIDGHINDPIFAETALAIFDDWCTTGVVEADGVR